MTILQVYKLKVLNANNILVMLLDKGMEFNVCPQIYDVTVV